MSAKKVAPVPIAPREGKFKISPKEERSWGGTVYDSKLEMKFHQELLTHFPTEHIHTQVPFTLQPGFRNDWDGKWQNPIVYRADFVLGDVVKRGGRMHPLPGSMVIDAKGMILPSFRTASRLFEYQHRMPVHAVKTMKHLRVLIEKHKKIHSMNKDILKRISMGSVFRVTNYVGADGSITDLKVRIIGRQGYLDLVKASKDALIDVAREVFSSPAAEAFSQDVRVSGFTKVMESLDKKLEKPEDESAAHKSKEQFETVSPDVLLLDGDPEKVAVLRLEVIEEFEIEPPTKKTKKQAVTLVRDMLEERLPLHRYRHRINLYSGKYERVDFEPEVS